MLKFIKISILISLTLAVIFISYNSFVEKGGFEPYIYWFLLVDLLCLILLYKKGSHFSLYTSFVLFIISSLVVTMGFRFVGEFIMRASFILLVTGFIQSLIESRNAKVGTQIKKS